MISKIFSEVELFIDPKHPDQVGVQMLGDEKIDWLDRKKIEEMQQNTTLFLFFFDELLEKLGEGKKPKDDHDHQ